MLDINHVIMLRTVRKSCMVILLTFLSVSEFVLFKCIIQAFIGSDSCKGDSIAGGDGNKGYVCAYLNGEQMNQQLYNLERPHYSL